MTPDQQIIAQDDANAVNYVLDAPFGRKFVWDLLVECGVFATSFRGEQSHLTAHQEGKRQIGLSLLEKVLTEQPNAFTLMRDENIAREATYAAARPEGDIDDE